MGCLIFSQRKRVMQIAIGKILMALVGSFYLATRTEQLTGRLVFLMQPLPKPWATLPPSTTQGPSSSSQFNPYAIENATDLPDLPLANNTQTRATEETVTDRTFFTDKQLKDLMWDVAADVSFFALDEISEEARQNRVRIILGSAWLGLIYAAFAMVGFFLASWLCCSALLLYGTIKEKASLLVPWRLLLLVSTVTWMGLHPVILGAMMGSGVLRRDTFNTVRGACLVFADGFLFLYAAYCYWEVWSYERKLKESKQETGRDDDVFQKPIGNGISRL